MLTDEMRAEGWKEHDGGPCPVAPDTPVALMYRDKPDPMKGIRIPFALAIRLDWSHDGQDDDIIAYRETTND